MNKDQKVNAKHKLNGEVKEFELVATALKRQSEGEAPRFYPWFSEDKATWANLVSIFGNEMLEEMALDALNCEFQLLYFQRSPETIEKQLVKDGKPAFITSKDGKQVPVMNKEKGEPRLDAFLGYIEDENLSGREITPDYCMRKAMAAQKAGNMPKAMEYMQKAQSLMVAAMAKATPKS